MTNDPTIINELEEIQHNAELTKTFCTAGHTSEAACRILAICASCIRIAEKLVTIEKANRVPPYI